MAELLVSICIPTYKMPGFLNRCLESIEMQDYKNVEVIISDDSPGEDIKAVAESFGKRLTIRYTHHSPALKSPGNWNFAMKQSQGDLYVLMHQDDWFSVPDAISHYVSSFEDPAVDFAFGFNIGVNEENETVLLQNSEAIPDLSRKPSLLAVRNIIGPPSNVFFRNRVKEWYDEHFVWLVDIEFYIRVLRKDFKYRYIKRHLVNIGLHKGQATVFCREHPEIVIRENVWLAAKLGTKGFQPVSVYDYYWRFLRNYGIRSVRDLENAGIKSDEIPDILRRMVKIQSTLPYSLLKLGPFSKLMMMAAYTLSR